MSINKLSTLQLIRIKMYCRYLIVIFFKSLIFGGTTYEESRSVALQNASNSGIRFILGGSVVLNSKGVCMLLNHHCDFRSTLLLC